MQTKRFSSAAFLGLILFLMSCGYRMNEDCCPWIGSTISVPYIGGDRTGEFTEALVREVASSGAFEYVDGCGQYRLCVAICSRCEENIGFRYDINKQGDLTNTVIPVEARARIVAEFSLIETCSGKTVMGPERITATVDFDHEFEGGSENLTLFSLGQLTDWEAAQEAVPGRGGRVLAQRIVDYIRFAW